jgi:hypothetical protein
MKSETTYHILWECSLSTDVWGACSTTIQKSVMNSNTFEKIFVCMMSNISMYMDKNFSGNELILSPKFSSI